MNIPTSNKATPAVARRLTWREGVAAGWIALVVLLYLRQVLSAFGVFYSP